MRIQQLQYIIKIVETGSMNEAAKQLFITQPSLSNAVKDLEMRWGLKSLSGILKGSLWLAMGWSSSLMPARWWSRLTSCPSAIKSRGLSWAFQRLFTALRLRGWGLRFSIEEKRHGKYELFLRETRTWEIIDDVKNFRSEVGVLFWIATTEMSSLRCWMIITWLPPTSLQRNLISLSARPILLPRKRSSTYLIWKISHTLAMTKEPTTPSTSQKRSSLKSIIKIHRRQWPGDPL